MNLKLPARIIELFTMYRRLNSVLDENWRDVSSKDFFSNFVDPVNSGWKQFHEQTNEALQSVRTIDSSTEQDEFQLHRMADEVTAIVNNNGLSRYIHCRVHLWGGAIDFLVPPSEAHYLATESSRLEYVMDKFPDADEDTKVETFGVVG